MASELYDIVEVCTNEELEPVVSTLIAAPSSSFGNMRAYERCAPDHTRYAEQIADEVYRLSVPALKQEGAGRPTNSAMLSGIYKQIGLSVTAIQESDLLNLFAKQHLSTVPVAQRQQLVDEACVAAGGASAGTFSADQWAPFTSSLLHLAFLRRKLEQQGRLPTRSPMPRSDAQPSNVHASGAPTMLVEAADGAPLFALAPAPGPATTTAAWQPAAEVSAMTTVLSPLLEAVQPFVSASEMLSGGNIYRAIIPAGQSLTWSDKVGAFVGTATDNKGMVGFDRVTLSSVAGPAAIPMLINAFLEQKRFERIEQGLAELKTAIGAVAKFQQDERRSVLTGSVRYYQQVAESVRDGELAAEVLAVIEQQELRLVQVQEHVGEDIGTQLARLKALKNDSWSKTKYIAAVEECLATLHDLFVEAMLCVQARACGYQLLCGFPGREAGKRRRKEAILGALALFAAEGEGRTLDANLRDKIAGISSWETKLKVLAREHRLLDHLTAQAVAIGAGLAAAVPSEADWPELITIDVRVENGSIAALRLPDQSLAEQQFARLLGRAEAAELTPEPTRQAAR